MLGRNGIDKSRTLTVNALVKRIKYFSKLQGINNLSQRKKVIKEIQMQIKWCFFRLWLFDQSSFTKMTQMINF